MDVISDYCKLSVLRELEDTSRVWLYIADRDLSTSEQDQLLAAGRSFVDSWDAHGKELQGRLDIWFDRILIIAVDEQWQEATGCSIDRSVHWIKDLGAKMGIDFFNRMIQPIVCNGKVDFMHVNDLKDKIESGEHIDAIAQPNPGSLRDLQEGWFVPLEQSWLAAVVG